MKIITLTTDFGTSDYFVGAMKGAILSINPEAIPVDITHEIKTFDVKAAALTLFAAHQTFPSGTIHVCVVDPGVGSARRPILAISKNHLFVAPDNGVLGFIYENEPSVRVFHITNDRFFRHPVSTTFHGRDIFAPVAGAVSRGVLPGELGEEITDFVRLELPKISQSDEETIIAEVFHIDHFGNCLLNLKSDDLPEKFHTSRFRVETANQTISKFQSFYSASAHQGDIFLIYGSADFLEIVAYKDSAARLLNLSVGQQVKVRCC